MVWSRKRVLLLRLDCIAGLHLRVPPRICLGSVYNDFQATTHRIVRYLYCRLQLYQD